MNKKNKILANLLKGKKVIEIGANTGDISLQIVEMNPSFLAVNEINKKYIKLLHSRLDQYENVEIFNFDLFKRQDYPDIKFDVIILKEIFNAFDQKDYNSIIKNSDSCLKNNGTICIIDYFPGVNLRQLILSTIINPHHIFFNINRFNHNRKNNRLMKQNDLIKFFPKIKYSINLYSRIDPLNKYDSLLHKFIEILIPMKYLAIIKKIK